jgi:type VI secretion system protein ImpH
VLGRRHCRLGEDCSIGDSVEELNSAFLMVLGPLPYERYARFLPGGRDAAALRSLVRLYIGEALEVEVEVRGEAARVEGSRLGRGDGQAMNRLGWDSRLADQRHDAAGLSVQFPLAHLAGAAAS